MDDPEEQFFPTLAFGFAGPRGHEKLMQLWVGSFGSQDWRPVPTIKLGKKPAAIAGFVPEEEEGSD